MKRFHLCLMTLILAASTAEGQSGTLLQRDLTSPTDTVRMNAFVRLQVAADADSANDVASLHDRVGRTAVLAAAAQRNPTLHRELLELLERENVRASHAAPGSLSADYLASYKPDLVVTIARLRDPNAFKLLLPSITLGDVVTSGIASAGDLAIDDVLLIWAKDTTATRRFAAGLTIGKILDANGARVSPKHRAQVRDMLLPGLIDSQVLVRLGAIQGLMSFRDSAVASEMKRLANSDQFSILQAGKKRYFVREAAERWLKTGNPGAPK